VGWRKTFSNKKMWGLLFLLNFVIALVGAIPFSGFLSRTVGHSVSNLKMLNGFDYAFLTEFMREHGDGVSVILNLSFGIILLYFIFSIFMMGGILSVLKEDSKFSFQKFWQGSSIYFWRLLRLTFYFFLIQIVLIAIFGFIFLRNGISPFELESEMIIIRSIMILVPIYLLISSIFFMVQDYAKVEIIHQNSTYITSPILDAFRFVFKNFRKCFGLYLLNLLTFSLFIGMYWLLKNNFEAKTSASILLILLIGQVFIISRIGVRIANLGSAISLFQNTKNPA